MFLGHLAVGFASKRVAPQTSLGLLVAAPLALDLLWPFFLALGWERVSIDPSATAFTPLSFDHYPWSHSLLMAVVWGLLLGGVYWLVTRYRPGALILFVAVVSHWIFDWITHRPDLPLVPGGATYGLGLWNSVAGTVAVELTLLAVALWLLRPRGLKLWSLIVFVVVAAASAGFGPPPPSVGALTATAFAIWLVPLWAWWGDRRAT
jgi:membrane-bound metal-dependent hydrolase YbcI (DUF457 family)